METNKENMNQSAADKNGGNQGNAGHSGFTAPVQDMAAAAKEYADIRINEVKIDAVENMAKGFGRLLSAVLVLQLTILVLTLSGLAAILLLGELIGSYALAALIIALVFAVLAVVVFLTRKTMFVGPFGKALTGIFFKDAPDTDIRAMRDRIRTERTFKEKELMLRGKYMQAFYSPANLFGMLSGKISAVFSILAGIAEAVFGKRKSHKAEETETDATAEPAAAAKASVTTEQNGTAGTTEVSATKAGAELSETSAKTTGHSTGA